MNRYSLKSNIQSQQSLLSSKLASEQKIPSSSELYREIISRKKLSIQNGLNSFPAHSQSVQHLTNSPKVVSKAQQMNQIEKELQGYKKIKKFVLTSILTQQNEPLREKFNKSVQVEQSPWEQQRKQRILQGRSELNRKFQIQKSAVTQYLNGEKVDNKIIKTHKEVVQPSPIQRAHNTPKDEQHVFGFTQPNLSQLGRKTNEGKFLYRSQKQLLESNEAKTKICTVEEKKRPKSAIISMISPEFLKIGKKAKLDDPIKIKMKEYLERFLKGEQQYFQILEQTKQSGQAMFFKSMQLSQKFYYDQLDETTIQFNQDDDLKAVKCFKLLPFRPVSGQQHPNRMVNNQEEPSQREKGTVWWKDQIIDDEREIEFEEQIAALDSRYSRQLQDQKESLEEFQSKLMKSKEGFQKNYNLPEKYQDFLKLVKRDNIEGVKHFIDFDPSIINTAVDHLGLTALHWAAKRDQSGKTALDHAIKEDQVKTVSLLMREEAFIKAEKQVQSGDNAKEKNNTDVSVIA